MKKLSLLVLSTALAAVPAFAASIAIDNASNYSGSWTGNEGSGFGAWSFSTSGAGGSYLGSTGEGNPSFGLFAGGDGGSDLSSASRGFTGDLTAGQTFSIDLGHSNGISSGGEVGINLTDGGSSVFTLKFVGGGANWLINDGGSDFGIGQGYAADTTISLSFTYNGGSDYSYSFGSASGDNFTATSTISGIDGFTLFSNNQGGGQNFGSDNISIVPEPSSYALLAGILGLAYVAARRRK
ncbi:MAG: PEP-CTERM sorting domain-containing protein [Opitutaceae bacterium]